MRTFVHTHVHDSLVHVFPQLSVNRELANDVTIAQQETNDFEQQTDQLESETRDLNERYDSLVTRLRDCEQRNSPRLHDECMLLVGDLRNLLDDVTRCQHDVRELYATVDRRTQDSLQKRIDEKLDDMHQRASRLTSNSNHAGGALVLQPSRWSDAHSHSAASHLDPQP